MLHEPVGLGMLLGLRVNKVAADEELVGAHLVGRHLAGTVVIEV